MSERTRVLVLSYLPPVTGGIATWAGILRDHPPNEGCRFEFERLPVAEPRQPFGSLLTTGIFLTRVARRLATERPDVVHLNCCLSPRGVWRDLGVAVVAQVLRVPVATHFHGSVPDVIPSFALPSRLAFQALTRLSSLLLCVTRDSRTLLERMADSEKAVEVPNFIEEGLTRRPRAEERLASGMRRVRAIYRDGSRATRESSSFSPRRALFPRSASSSSARSFPRCARLSLTLPRT